MEGIPNALNINLHQFFLSIFQLQIPQSPAHLTHWQQTLLLLTPSIPHASLNKEETSLQAASGQECDLEMIPG